MEAFNPLQDVEQDMLHSEWDDYVAETGCEKLLASEWHHLFGADATDPRGKLTWRGLLAEMPGVTRYNFYSPSEDVVGNSTHGSDESLVDIDQAWAAQEKLKGRMVVDGLCGSRHAGWQFNRTDYGIWLQGTWTRMEPEYAAGISDEALKTTPFFFRLPVELFAADSSAARAYAEEHLFDLLARAIPARSFGMAANSASFDDTGIVSVNMQTECENGWPREQAEWHHSDLKAVAYKFNYMLYKKLVTEGELR